MAVAQGREMSFGSAHSTIANGLKPERSEVFATGNVDLDLVEMINNTPGYTFGVNLEDVRAEEQGEGATQGGENV